MDQDFLSQIDKVKDLLPETSAEKLDDEVLVCECFCVNVRDIREVCSQTQYVDVQLLQNSLSLGMGCTSCLKMITDWQNKIF